MTAAPLRPLTRLPADAPLDEIMAIYRRDGGVIVEAMFDRATIDAMREAADRRAPAFPPGTATQGMGAAGAAFVGANTVRFSSLPLLDDAYFDMLDNACFAAIADAVLLPHCGSYWVNTGQIMYIGPGEQAQGLHRDAENWPQYMRSVWPDAVDITISAMIGIDDVTEELGATRVVPGSHRWTDLDDRAGHPSVPAELDPGDALIYSGYVLHGGGANQTTNRWRKAMHLSFVAGWLTPEESCALDFPLGGLDERSPRVQRLLGHRSYTPMPHPGGGLWLRHVQAIEERSD
ncbi:MAG: phytanoyl-CoA dioxygenase family protein [Actinomycetota bacterium]